MNRLRFIAALAIAALTVVPTSALAARVQIRVEGRTQTIYAAAPRTLDASNALEALDRASLAGEFYYGVTTTSFGPFVSQILPSLTAQPIASSTASRDTLGIVTGSS